MGNKKLVIIGAVTAIIILGLAGFFIFGNKNTQPSTAENSESSNSKLMTSGMSLKDILTLQQDQKCTFSNDDGVEGTVYVGNGKARGDFKSVMEGKATNSYMINDGTTLYLWSEGQSEGFKGNIDELTELSSKYPNFKDSIVNPDDRVQHECTGWSVDESLFKVPSNINFTDFSEILNSLPTGFNASQENGESMSGTDAQCSACDSLPTEAAAQCRSALSC